MPLSFKTFIRRNMSSNRDVFLSEIPFQGGLLELAEDFLDDGWEWWNICCFRGEHYILKEDRGNIMMYIILLDHTGGKSESWALPCKVDYTGPSDIHMEWKCSIWKGLQPAQGVVNNGLSLHRKLQNVHPSVTVYLFKRVCCFETNDNIAKFSEWRHLINVSSLNPYL